MSIALGGKPSQKLQFLQCGKRHTRIDHLWILRNMRKKSVVVLCAYECLPVYECLLCMAPCVTPPDFIWEEELNSHYHFSYTISRKITYNDLLDLHVRSLLCYLWVLGLMGLFALPHWTSYITMCFYFLKRCKFSARLRHPKCTHIYIIYTCKHRLEDQNKLASTHFSHFFTSFGKYVIIQIPKCKLPRSLFSWRCQSMHVTYVVINIIGKKSSLNHFLSRFAIQLVESMIK